MFIVEVVEKHVEIGNKIITNSENFEAGKFKNKI